MKKKVRRSPLSRRVESALALPDGLLGHCTKMEWTDNRQVQMDGCCAVLEYEEDHIEIAVAGGAVQFWGQGLCLNFLSADSVMITGQIQSVEFANE